MNLQDIISGCKNRDLKAEKELYYLFAKRVYGLAKKYVTDTQEAEDLLQECFITVFTQIQRFDETKGKFESWLYKVSLNTILQSFRRKKTQIKTVNIDLTPEPRDEIEDYKEISEAFIEQALSDLPKGYKQVFQLFVLQQWSHQKIADHLKITEGTSRSQLSKAKKHLRHFIQLNASQIYEGK